MVMEEVNAETHNQSKWLRISKARRVRRWGDVQQKGIFLAWHSHYISELVAAVVIGTRPIQDQPPSTYHQGMGRRP